MIIDTLGILVTAVLSGARLHQLLRGEWWVLPLFAHAAISAFLLLTRPKTNRKATALQSFIAWVSALLPFAVQVENQIPLLLRTLSIVGVIFAVWTLVVLGKSFDVSPADRHLVQHGPYKFVRHPMYASEIFSTIMIVLAQVSLWNMLVTVMLVATILLRINWEESIISDYATYSGRVRARLIPGVW